MKSPNPELASSASNVLVQAVRNIQPDDSWDLGAPQMSRNVLAILDSPLMNENVDPIAYESALRVKGSLLFVWHKISSGPAAIADALLQKSMKEWAVVLREALGHQSVVPLVD